MTTDLKAKLVLEGDATGAVKATGQVSEGLEQAGERARTAGERIDDAFGVVGVRSTAQIKAEILKITQALDGLAREGRVSGADFARAWESGQARLRELKTEIDGAQAGVADFASKLSPLARELAVAFSVREVAQMAAEFDGLVRSLQAISGADAAREIGYITEASSRLGLDLASTSKAYASWLASIRGTALEGEKGRQVFEAVSGAMSRLGKSSADTQGVIEALSQMVGKGVVQMEELRGQLGDRLPGAMKAAADGAGLTEAQLIKMVDAGGVLAEDLLPGLAAQLNKLYGSTGEVEGYTASWNRLMSAVTESVGRLGQVPVVAASVSASLATVREVVLVLGTGVLTAAEGVTLLAKSIGAVSAAAASGDWSLLREEIVKMAGESAERINALASKTLIAQGVQKAFGQEIARTGQEAATAASRYLAIQAAYTEVNQAAAKATELAQKSSEARAAEARAAEAVAQAFGTEADKRRVAAEQAAIESDALGRLAEAKQAEAQIAAANLAAIQAEVEAQVAAGQKISQAKQDEIDKLKQAVAAKAADAEKSQAAADAAKIHAAATEADTLTLVDNSRRVNELRGAWSQASTAASILHAELAAGRVTKDDVAKADLAAGQAARLYRDALSDATAAIQARAAASRSGLSVQERERSLQLEIIQTQIEVAKARGRDNEVAQLQFEYSRVQAELSALKARALRAEADAQLALVAAKRAELEASGQLTEVKRLELDAQQAAARAKRVDADIADELARRARELRDVVRSSGDEMRAATTAADGLGDAWQGAASKADALAASAKRARAAAEGVNADGTVTRTQFTSSSDNFVTGLENGLTPDQAKVFSVAYSEAIARANARARGKAQGVGVGFSQDDYFGEMKTALAEALAEARNATPAGVASASSSVGGNFYPSSAVQTVNVVVGGKTIPVQVANRAQVNNLVAALQEAAAAAGN